MLSFNLSGGALAEGFQERLKEFQSFERRFEVYSFCHTCFKYTMTLSDHFRNISK